MNTLVPPPERHASMRLPDGRMLAWSEWGPPDGRPVLFCTGAGMSGALGFGASALPELEVRLMALERPGVGRSDPHPHKTLASWAADVQAWVAANRLERLGAVAFSQGAPFGFALAGSGLVAALAVVAGQDELAHPHIRPLLHPEVARMVAAVEQDPVSFEDAFSATASADGLWQLIVGMSGAHDRQLYLSDAFGTAYQRALQEGFAQGARNYVRDLVNALGPWLVAPEQIAAPVDLWYGAKDTSTVHSPDFGATLAARLPNATYTLDPRAGGSILWTRGHDILARLVAHLGDARRG